MSNQKEYIEYQLDIEDVRFTFFAVNFIQTGHKSDKGKPDFHSHLHFR